MTKPTIERASGRRGADEPLRHEGHRRPMTRRDFLAQGFITGAAAIAAPSIFRLLGGSGLAQAQTVAACGISAGAGKIPFLCFDLAGGANVAGSNVMVGGAGGQLDFLSAAGYLKMGLPAGMTPDQPNQLNSELGLVFHADSAFLRGILDKTSVTTRAKVNGTVICARSDNDTGNNPHNPMYGINKAGADGDLVTLIGTKATESGGRSMAPLSMIDPKVRPTKIDRPSDATGLVDTGKLVELLDQDDAAAVMRSVEAISDLKLAKMDESQPLEDQIYCNYVRTTNLVAQFGDPTLLSPLNDPIISGAVDSIFDATEIMDREFSKTATVMKLVVDGFAGAGTIEFGGYDYHNSTRSRGELKDFEAGQAMGAALEYAARRGQQLVLYIFSDGSVASNGVLDNSTDGRGKGIWKSDNSSTAAVFMLVYDPVDRPALSRLTSNQIGHYRTDGSVETSSSRVANNVVQLAQSVVLNYMALHDDVGRFSEVLPDHQLGTGADLDALVAFEPIRNVGP
jgi:hypothetical protein